MDSYIQNLFAERIGGSKFGKENVIYKFEKIKRAKREAIKNHPGVEILDFGVGEPDDMADKLIRERLKEEVDVWENRGYADNGIEEFKQAAARYMKKVFNVDVNPEKHILHGIGSKPVLAMFPSIFINPGDVTIMTVPGYPVLGTHTKWLGGEVYNIQLKEENNFLPKLDSIPQDIIKRAKILVLNYPNNPTGACADESFYKEVVAFAKENNIVVVQDAAYSALVYGGKKPLSFLSIPGAMDVGVEIHSLSKAYNMTGWRLAFVVGNELIIKAYGTVKDNIDSGQFKAIQKSGITALDNPQITEKIREKYERRLNKMVKILNKKGFNAKMPGGTFYLYVKVPKKVNGINIESAEMFSEYMIKEKLISTVPWDDAGSYIRFSATFVAKNIEDEERVLKELEKRLESLKFEF